MVINILLDVCSGREVLGITANVEVVRVLVDTNPIYAHSRGEGQVLEIDITEVPRHSQVNNDVL